jgi:hypothetical protein
LLLLKEENRSHPVVVPCREHDEEKSSKKEKDVFVDESEARGAGY